MAFSVLHASVTLITAVLSTCPAGLAERAFAQQLVGQFAAQLAAPLASCLTLLASCPVLNHAFSGRIKYIPKSKICFSRSPEAGDAEVRTWSAFDKETVGWLSSRRGRDPHRRFPQALLLRICIKMTNQFLLLVLFFPH